MTATVNIRQLEQGQAWTGAGRHGLGEDDRKSRNFDHAHDS